MRDNISHNRSSFTHKASYLFIQSCVDFNIICQGLEYRLHCVRVQVWARNTELTQMLIPINPKLSRWRMKQIWRHSKWNNETKVLRVGVDPMAFRMGGAGGVCKRRRADRPLTVPFVPKCHQPQRKRLIALTLTGPHPGTIVLVSIVFVTKVSRGCLRHFSLIVFLLMRFIYH